MNKYVNAKVLPLLVVAGVAGVVVYPPLLGFLPLLLLALCPLSMIFLGGHGSHGARTHEPGQAPRAEAMSGQYVCPMHGDARSEGPGRCPKCGMALVLAAGTPVPSTDGVPVVDSAADIEGLTREFHALNTRQAALAREIERLRDQRRLSTSIRAVEEAEEIARAADNGDTRRRPEA